MEGDKKMRRLVVTLYRCGAPEELFKDDWEEVPQSLKEQVPADGLHCDGGGVPGSWCRGCTWEVRPECMEERGAHLNINDLW